MTLQRKTEVKRVALDFGYSSFRADVTWNVGVVDETGAWTHAPETRVEQFPSTDSDSMKRFNDALGVMHAECVRLTVAARQKAEVLEVRSKAYQNECAELREVNARLGKQLENKRQRAQEKHDGWTSEIKLRLDRERAYESWLYRLTLGFFPR